DRDPRAGRHGQPDGRPQGTPDGKEGLLVELSPQARAEGHAFRPGPWRQGGASPAGGGRSQRRVPASQKKTRGRRLLRRRRSAPVQAGENQFEFVDVVVVVTSVLIRQGFVAPSSLIGQKTCGGISKHRHDPRSHRGRLLSHKVVLIVASSTRYVSMDLTLRGCKMYLAKNCCFTCQGTCRRKATRAIGKLL
ncbi:unnamed protein product, partial [Ectocarpus sp. 8 AP-2014]